ncbi:PAS domain-containing protein [candidate division WWE3 bacterium]|uniref:histidine kinase n=1 Tax=candidate division WWE3 bacterium TaxID=2053526 RepID=A0A955LK23_UNCKA|nr:PAS domain-containing protein [candidate division WWE3 bacterium]
MLTISDQLFTLQFNIYVLYPILFLIVTVSLLIYTLRTSIEEDFKFWLKLIFGMPIVVGLAEIFARSSVYHQGAMFWWTVGECTEFLFTILTLGWTIVLIGKQHLIRGMRKYLLFFPFLLVLPFLLMNNGIFTQEISSATYGFGGFERVQGDLYFVLVIWIAGLNSISGILIAWYRFHTKDKLRKKQADLFLIGFVITMVINVSATATHGLQIGGFHLPYGGAIYLLPVTISIGLGVIKYRIYFVNPATLAENVIKTISEIVFVVNPNNYKIEYVSGATEKTLGYTTEKIGDMKLDELFGEYWQKVLESTIQPVVTNIKEREYTDLEVRSADGEMVPLQLSISAYKNLGNVYGIIIVATDLRETRELLDVAAERNKLSMIQESITEGVIGLDYERNILHINSAALRLLDRSDDVIGMDADEVFTLYDQGKKVDINDLVPNRKYKQDEVVARLVDIELVNGETRRTVNLISSAIKEGKDVDFGAILTIYDRSAERELERMKSDFVAMAAHELRTPLTAIYGYLGLLVDELKEAINQDQLRYLTNSVNSVKRLSVLIDDIIMISHIEKGEVRLEKELIRIEDLIGDVVKQKISQAAEKGLTIKFVMPDPKLPEVLIDPNRISTVLSNLIDNSIKFSDQGEITIDTNYRESDKTVSVMVQDTGIGIPSESLPHVFDKFYHVASVKEMQTSGHGLGLYLAKEMVNMHHGEIVAESNGLGQGATFKFTIPVG